MRSQQVQAAEPGNELCFMHAASGTLDAPPHMRVHGGGSPMWATHLHIRSPPWRTRNKYNDGCRFALIPLA